MKRKFDLYMNQYYPDVKTIDDCIDFLNASTYDSILSLPPGSKIASIFCFVSYLCGYASEGELQFMLGPYFGIFANHAGNAARRGYLDKFSLPLTDFGSYVGYRLTDDGFAAYLSGISNSLKEWGGVHQKRRTSSGSRGDKKTETASEGEGGAKRSSVKKSVLPFLPMHDYGLGVSILSLLSTRREIAIQKEAVIWSGAAVGTSGKLRADALVSLSNPDMPALKSHIYLEQDMGTESARQLINKLYVYGDSRILNPSRNSIVLSCHAPSGTIDGIRFEAKAMGKLCAEIAASGEKDVYSYYLSHCPRMTVTQRAPIESLLVCVGVADRRRKRPDGLFERVPDSLFSVAEFSDYVESLKNGNNPYLERYVNARLTNIAKKTFRSVCDGLEKLFFESGRMSSFLCDSLFNGYGIYVLPSTLLANSSHLFLRAEGAGRLDRYVDSVAGYYPDFRGEYGYVSNVSVGGDSFSVPLVIPLPGGNKTRRISFSNTFFSMTGDLVCFEHIGRDAGAFIRLLALAKAVNREELNLHVIAVCDSIDDADFFCRRVDPLPFIRGKNGGKGFRFTFLFEHTAIGDGCSPLFEFSKPFNAASVYLLQSTNMPIRPKKYNASEYEVFDFSTSSFA
jgi:hypothetical protein